MIYFCSHLRNWALCHKNPLPNHQSKSLPTQLIRVIWKLATTENTLHTLMPLGKIFSLSILFLFIFGCASHKDGAYIQFLILSTSGRKHWNFGTSEFPKNWPCSMCTNRIEGPVCLQHQVRLPEWKTNIHTEESVTGTLNIPALAHVSSLRVLSSRGSPTSVLHTFSQAVWILLSSSSSSW